MDIVKGDNSKSQKKNVSNKRSLGASYRTVCSKTYPNDIISLYLYRCGVFLES